MAEDDLALARRIERAWGEAARASALAFAAARGQSDVAVAEIGGGIAAYFGPGSPLSQAQGLGFDGPVAESELDRLDAFFLDRGATPSVEVASLADPGLLPALSRRGHHIAEQTHMLVRAMSPLDAALPVGARIEKIDPADSATRSACNQTILRAFFEGPDDPPAVLLDVMEALGAAEASSTWFARLGDGAPAGGASLIVLDALALFAGDATLPAWRGRGVQSALIHARLAEADRRGCTLAIACVQPGSTSQRNYERLGFRLLYARTLMARPSS